MPFWLTSLLHGILRVAFTLVSLSQTAAALFRASRMVAVVRGVEGLAAGPRRSETLLAAMRDPQTLWLPWLSIHGSRTGTFTFDPFQYS